MEALHEQLIAPSAPPPVDWWPPAPGWWVVAATLLLLLLLLPWLQRQRRQHRKRRRQQGMHTLDDIPAELTDSHWLAEINIRLKQRLKQRGDEAATRLFGEAWLDYLCSRHPDIRREALQPLAADLYRPQLELSGVQRQALLGELHRWMRHEHV